MVYHGRIVVAGTAEDGSPMAAYAISGRSPGSKKRRFEVVNGDRVYVGPIGSITPEQEKSKDLIFYNAMRARDDGLLFVTNGAQTDVILSGKTKSSFYDEFTSPGDALTIMNQWGYEPDAPIFTPRIALVRYPNNRCLFASVVKDGEHPRAEFFEDELSHLTTGSAIGLATYQGRSNEAKPWNYDDGLYMGYFLISTPVKGESPIEIAESLYNFLDQDFVSASAGAVFYKGKWHLAVKNRFQSQEEFNDYMKEQEKK